MRRTTWDLGGTLARWDGLTNWSGACLVEGASAMPPAKHGPRPATSSMSPSSAPNSQPPRPISEPRPITAPSDPCAQPLGWVVASPLRAQAAPHLALRHARFRWLPARGRGSCPHEQALVERGSEGEGRIRQQPDVDDAAARTRKEATRCDNHTSTAFRYFPAGLFYPSPAGLLGLPHGAQRPARSLTTRQG